VIADDEHMAPDLILVVAGLSAAWAVFSIVGGERQRVLQNIELVRRATDAAADAGDGAATKGTAVAAIPAAKSSH
jgi:hypothetical protein